MVKIGLVKCPSCEKDNEKEDAVKFKTRYYCPECLEKKKETLSKNSDGWDELYQYMKTLYGSVNTKMITQVAKYRKDPYDYTNRGMELTLYYYHELLTNPPDKEAVGLIPYYYDKAKEEFIINMEIHKHNSNMVFEEKIKRIKVIPTKNKNNYTKKLIDLDALGGTYDE